MDSWVRSDFILRAISEQKAEFVQQLGCSDPGFTQLRPLIFGHVLEPNGINLDADQLPMNDICALWEHTDT